jgi:hypothetical protein
MSTPVLIIPDDGLQFPNHIMHDTTGGPLTTAAMAEREFSSTITGSNGSQTLFTARPIAQYRSNVNCHHVIWTVNIHGCPVSTDCPAQTHSMLLLQSVAGAYQYIYDLPSVLINSDTAQVATLWADHRDTAYCITNAVCSVAGSFQYNNPIGSWPYAATIFDGAITMNNDVNAAGEEIIYSIWVPNSKRLITGDDSLHIEDDSSTIVHFRATTRDHTDDTDNTDDTDTTDTSDVDVNELQSQLEMVTGQRDSVAAMLENCREVVIRYTRDNGGCDEGKVGFLTATGLWPDHDESEIGELVGIETQREYTIDLMLSCTVSVTREMRPSDADELSAYDVTDIIDVDDVVRDNLRYIDFEVSDIEVSES